MSRLLTESLFQAVDTQDWLALSEIFHRDIIYERPGYRTLVGIEQLLSFYRNERVIRSGSHQLETVLADEVHGACWGRFIGVTKDGRSIDERFADVYTYDGKKIIRRRTFFFRPAI